MYAIKKDSSGIVIVKAQRPVLEDDDIEVSPLLFNAISPPCTYIGNDEDGYTIIPCVYENEPVAVPETETPPPSYPERITTLELENAALTAQLSNLDGAFMDFIVNVVPTLGTGV